LRACPECLRQGFHWWQCYHQLPGVVVCAEHPSIALHDTSVPRSQREDRPNHIDLRDARVLKPCIAKLSPLGLHHATEVATALRTLLCTTVPHPGPEQFREWLRDQLRARGFARPFGKVDLQRSVAALGRWLSSDFATAVGLPVPTRADDDNWFVAILTTRRSAIHPTLAVVCSLFVETEIKSALLAADSLKPQPRPPTRPMRRGISAAHARFEKSKVRLRSLWGQSHLSISAIGRRLEVHENTVSRWARALGLKFPRRGPGGMAHGLAPRRKSPPFDIRVSDHRRRWRTVIRSLPRNAAGVSRNPLTRNLYNWLWRYDPEWLCHHVPKSSHRSLVNWSRRDRDIASRVATAAAEIRARVLPTRASRTRIIALIRMHQLFQSSARLPKARAALARHTESHREFVPRRLRALFDVGSLSRRALVTAVRKQPSLSRNAFVKEALSTP
jgi:hypothetical protein